MSITFATRTPKQLQAAAATLTAYFFDTSKPEQAAQYAELVAARRAAGVRVSPSHSPDTYNANFTSYWRKIDEATGRDANASGTFSAPVTVELEFVFDDQMNTAAPLNARLFDWNEIVSPSRVIKYGYFVESEGLARARANTCACGYCGAQYENAEPGQFCAACLEGPHLTIDTLHLLRLRRISDKSTASRPPLSPEERADLLPVFEKARTEGITKRGIARQAKARADVAAEFDKSIAKATKKRDAYTWLLDHGVDLDNVIFYDHKDVFTFGWSKHIEGEELERLRGKLAEFPFNYDINPAK